MSQSLNRRMVVAAVVAVIALAAASAQSGSPARSAYAAHGYRVAGTVVNATTGEPVRGAAVALLTVADSQVVASTESGDDGQFAMEGISAAKYQLTASKRGYSTSFYNQHWEYNSAVVTGPGQDTEHLVFRLAPAAVIYGVVTGDGGDPVEGASVMLYEKPHRHVPGEQIEQVQAVQTDDTGAYEFASLEPGDYMIAVKAKPWYATSPNPANTRAQETEAQAALDVAYPTTYYDSTTDDGSATTITLATGAREEADVSLHAVQALHLTVATTRGRGAPQPALRETIFGTTVQSNGLQSAMTEMIEGATPQGQENPGTVDFSGLAPGHYELMQGDPPRMAQLDATSSQQVDPTEGVPTQTVSGVVQTGPGSPLAGNGMITLQPAEGTGPSLAATQIMGGSFKFANVPPGTWLVEAMNQQAQLPVLAVGPRGGKAQAGNRVTVEDKPLSLVVTVSAGNTRIEGFSSKGGKGAAGVMVILVPKDIAEIAELARRDQTDSDGSFALLNVAPGDYTLVAVDDAWGMDWFDPAIISRYLPQGIAVTVKDKSEKVQRLDKPVPVQAR